MMETRPKTLPLVFSLPAKERRGSLSCKGSSLTPLKSFNSSRLKPTMKSLPLLKPKRLPSMLIIFSSCINISLRMSVIRTSKIFHSSRNAVKEQAIVTKLVQYIIYIYIYFFFFFFFFFFLGPVKQPPPKQAGPPELLALPWAPELLWPLPNASPKPTQVCCNVFLCSYDDLWYLNLFF